MEHLRLVIAAVAFIFLAPNVAAQEFAISVHGSLDNIAHYLQAEVVGDSNIGPYCHVDWMKSGREVRVCSKNSGTMLEFDTTMRLSNQEGTVVEICNLHFETYLVDGEWLVAEEHQCNEDKRGRYSKSAFLHYCGLVIVAYAQIAAYVTI